MKSALITAALFFLLSAATAVAQTTTFTYQGRLTDGGAPANGNYDMQFRLFDSESGGTQIDATNERTNVAVSGGTFTVKLDFGDAEDQPAFSGADRYLEIRVRPSGGAAAFTTLSPRQQITSTPYSLRARRAVALADANQYIRNSGIPQTPASFAVSGNGHVGGNMGVSGALTAGSIISNGNVDIGGTLNVANLSGGGGATPVCIPGGNNPNVFRICNSSSLRYKTQVRPFAGGLDVINHLRPISFTWKENGTEDFGLGAEAVAQVEPQLIFHNAQGQIEGVRYDRINVVLINAIKQQQEQLERQQAQIDRLTRLVRRPSRKTAARRAR